MFHVVWNSPLERAAEGLTKKDLRKLTELLSYLFQKLSKLPIQ